MAGLSVPVWESKLCALLLCFSPAEPNHALLAIHWLRPDEISLLIGGRAHQGEFRSFSFVYMLGEKSPQTTVTLGNRAILS